MKIAELMSGKKNKSVEIRVPVKLQQQLGAVNKGTVQRIVPGGSVTWVEVKVGRKGIFRFRPQDLSLA